MARLFRVALRVTVLRPLPDISGHVEQSERVRGLGARLVSSPARVARIPRMIRRRIRGVTPPELRRRAGPCRILPLRLARQPIAHPSWRALGTAYLIVQPSDIRLCIDPAHADDG